MDTTSWTHFSPSEVQSFMRRCMESVNVKPAHAEVLAEVLMKADYRGHYSHGLNRLDMYVKDVQQGICEINKEPEILKESPASAWVEGNNILGPVIGKFCMDLAIQKAKQCGVGWVVAKGSNHYGIAGWYSMRAMEQGLVGMAFTNTSPLVNPTRSAEGVLGTNPLAVAAPAAKDGDSFALDMATSTVALGKIELNERKGMDIPDGWGCDKNGKQTNNPTEVLTDGGLLPLGGTEESGGYKGYGLGMMVEMLCGIMAGSSYGPNIRSWKSRGKIANLGQCFIAVNPDMFAPGFPDRMTDLMDYCRDLTPSEGEDPVLVPGDPERSHEKVCNEKGIAYHPNQVQYMEDLASELKVEPMAPL